VWPARSSCSSITRDLFQLLHGQLVGELGRLLLAGPAQFLEMLDQRQVGGEHHGGRQAEFRDRDLHAARRPCTGLKLRTSPGVTSQAW